MNKKLVTKAELARRLGVSKATITRMCKTRFVPAVDGLKVDMDHDVVLDYLEEIEELRQRGSVKQPGDPVDGTDLLYGEAVEYLKESGTASAWALRKHFSIGTKRATKLINMIEASGALPAIKREAAKREKARAGEEDKKPKIAPSVAATTKREPTKREPTKPTKREPPKPTNNTTEPSNRKKSYSEQVLDLAKQANISEKEARWQLDLNPVDENVRAYLTMPLGDIVTKFGTLHQFKVLLDARKSIEEIRQKQLKSEEVENKSIDKAFVTGQLLAAMHICFDRLLTDAPKSITSKLYALAQADASMADGEKAAHDVISSQLVAARDKIVEKLKEVE